MAMASTRISRRHLPHHQQGKLSKHAGLPHFFVPVVGAGHGFDYPEDRVRSRIVFDRYLRGIEADISNEPIRPPGEEEEGPVNAGRFHVLRERLPVAARWHQCVFSRAGGR
jgi:hypothetical protein